MTKTEAVKLETIVAKIDALKDKTHDEYFEDRLSAAKNELLRVYSLRRYGKHQR